jgi:hypothetical protein
MNVNVTKVVLAISSSTLALLGCGVFSSLLGRGASLQDDFSDSSSGWGTDTDSESSVEYSNGGFQMQVFTPNYITWSTPDTTDYENVHLEVTVRHNDTNPTTAFGIICNEQGSSASYYYFAITPGGQYAIIKATVAQTDFFLTNNDQWGSSDLIAQDAASYRVAADCGRDGRLTLYVDGQQVDSVTDMTYTKGRVGLITWSGEEKPAADVIFDDFVMTALP